MLSGEGKQRWRTVKLTTIGLISKKATLRMQHTFLYISWPWFCTTTTWNFQKLLSYTFYGGNVVRILVHFFDCRSFLPALVAASVLILSPPLQYFHVVLPTKNCLLCCLSLVLDLCRPFSRWTSLACRPLSLFLCLSLALYSKFVDTTVYLSFIHSNFQGVVITPLVGLI